MKQPKTRLTITLAPEILQQIDNLIDKQTIRNRSHAIEHILMTTLQPKLRTAVILAGGSNDDHRDIIRPLALINGKPLIQHTLEHFQKFGVTKIIIATTPRGRAIQDLVGDGSQWGVHVEYFFESTPLGTAGALQPLKHLLPKESFLVWSGDILTDINLHDLAAFHQKHKALATIAVKPRSTHQSYDNVFVQGHHVVNFKPSTADQQVSIVNASIYVFEPEVLELLPPPPAMLETDVIPLLTRSHRVVAFVFQGMWFDIEADQSYQTRPHTQEAA